MQSFKMIVQGRYSSMTPQHQLYSDLYFLLAVLPLSTDVVYAFIGVANSREFASGVLARQPQ